MNINIEESEIRRIATKYVYGNHSALTDRQEIEDMVKDIKELIEVEVKKLKQK